MDEGGDEEGALDAVVEATYRGETTTLPSECVGLKHAVQEEENVVRRGVNAKTVEKDVDDRGEVGDPAAVFWTSKGSEAATVLDEQEVGEEIRHCQRTEVLVEEKEDFAVAAQIVNERG